MSGVAEAGDRQGGRARKHKSAKSPVGRRLASTTKVRASYHLEERTITRLDVHASLVGRNVSGLVNEIILRYLNANGATAELFGKAEITVSDDHVEVPDVEEDRQDGPAT